MPTSISEAKLSANRQNAQASTGPTSDTGKAASAKNATTHGLTASHPVLKSPTDHTDFATLRDTLAADLKPAPGLEQILFNQILIAAWNMQRCDAHIASLADRGLDPIDLSASGAEAHTAARNIDIYYRRNERSFHKALKTLRDLQTERTYRELAQTQSRTANISTLVRTQPLRRAALVEDQLKTQIEAVSIRNAKQVPELAAHAYTRAASEKVLNAI